MHIVTNNWVVDLVKQVLSECKDCTCGGILLHQGLFVFVRQNTKHTASLYVASLWGRREGTVQIYGGFILPPYKQSPDLATILVWFRRFRLWRHYRTSMPSPTLPILFTASMPLYSITLML